MADTVKEAMDFDMMAVSELQLAVYLFQEAVSNHGQSSQIYLTIMYC